MCNFEVEVDDPIERWRKGMEALSALKPPALVSLRQTAENGGADSVAAAVLYLEAVVTATLDTVAGTVDDGSAGRCLLAEDVLFILTGSCDLAQVRTWIRARGLEPVTDC